MADGGLIVERALTDGYEVVEAPLPALITVSNELGEPRYPTLRGIMAASKKSPTVWTSDDLGLEAGQLAARVELLDLYVPASEKQCAFVDGEDGADAGRKLAIPAARREADLIPACAPWSTRAPVRAAVRR